jgi:hypothetical protein
MSIPFNFLGPAIGSGTASSPEFTVASATTLGADGNPEGGIEVSFRMAEPPDTVAIYSRARFSETSASNAVLMVELLKNAVYYMRCGAGPEVVVKTGDADTMDLPTCQTHTEVL